MEIEKKLIKEEPIIIGFFCLLASERLFRIYEKFSKKFNLPSQKLKDTIDESYYILFKKKYKEVDFLKVNLAALIPDSEAYSDVLADQAQCSVISVVYTLEYISEHNFLMVRYVFQKIEEAIDIIGHERGENIKKILIKEEKWQLELLKKLTDLSILDMKSVASLREININYSIPCV